MPLRYWSRVSSALIVMTLLPTWGCITYRSVQTADAEPCAGAVPERVGVIVRPVAVSGRVEDSSPMLWDAASRLASRFEEEGVDARVYATLAEAPTDRVTLESYPGEAYAPPRAVPVNLFWLLSLGVIPKFGSVDLGHHFQLRPSKQAAPVEVVAQERVRYAVGWLVGPWIWLTGAPRGVPRPSNPTLLTDALRRALGARCTLPAALPTLPSAGASPAAATRSPDAEGESRG